MGRIDTDLLNKMVEKGPSYLHAVANYESNVIKWNKDHEGDLVFPLVLVYPKEGTFWFDQPLCLLTAAEWASPAQLEGAAAFRDFLIEEEQLRSMLDFGIRPHNEEISLDTPSSRFLFENGVDPRVTPASVPLLPYPSPAVMDNIIAMWREEKKPVSAMLVIDTSGSMGVEAMNAAKEAAELFVEAMLDQDNLYLLEFNSGTFLFSSEGSISLYRNEILRQIRSLSSSGQTALYDAIFESVGFMQEKRDQGQAEEITRSYSIVLMTDGVDTSSFSSEVQMLNSLPDGSEASQLHIFTVAFGSNADTALLSSVAHQTNGKFFEASASDVSEIYQLISMEF